MSYEQKMRVEIWWMKLEKRGRKREGVRERVRKEEREDDLFFIGCPVPDSLAD